MRHLSSILDRRDGKTYLVIDEFQANRLRRCGLLDNPSYRLSAWRRDVNSIDVLDVGLRWIESLNSPGTKRWLLLTGKPGTGKTMMTNILAVLWSCLNDCDARVVSWSQWLNARRESYNNSNPVELQPLIDLPFLGLDDVTLELSAHSLKMLWIVLDGRLMKPTIVTMNTDIKEFKRALRTQANGDDSQDYAQKIISRMSSGEGGPFWGRCVFDGEDFRTRGRNGQ